jgi:hypothetical protein
MAEVNTLFWDNGGVILTNGWDRESRQRAVEKFHLDWADFEDRHELMLHTFETGELTLDNYLRRTVFYRSRPFTSEEFKTFMFEQSQPFPNTASRSSNCGIISRRFSVHATWASASPARRYIIARFRSPSASPRNAF